MQKPTLTGKPAPKAVDDPLAQLIDKHSDEVEAVAVPPADSTIVPTPGSDVDPG